jgi:GH24 family phage-related lysozyme (muramidase)
VLIIKKFETLHKPKHWPTICYGHVVQRGEHFTCRQYSEREADALLRRDYAKFCELYKEYGRDKVLLSES